MKKKDFLSFLLDWKFIKEFIKDLVINELQSIPLLGSTIKSIESVIEKAEIEFSEVQKEIANSAQSHFKNVSQREYNLSLPLYTQKGLISGQRLSINV